MEISINRTVALHKRALKNKLPCQGMSRQRLLDQFGDILDAFLEDHPEPATEELYAAFGSPEEMAEQLSAGISDEEAKQYSRNKTVKRVIAAVLAVVILLFAVYVFFEKQKPITTVDEIIVQPTSTSTSQ